MEYSKAIEQEILPESDKASWLRHLQDFKHERKKLRIVFEGSKNVKTNSASSLQTHPSRGRRKSGLIWYGGQSQV